MVSYRRLAMRVLGHVPVPFGKKKASPPPRVAAQRIAALALACAMMTGMTLPTFAATYDIVSGSIDIHATEDGNLISQWNWNDENQKEYVSDSSGYIKDRLDNEITITGTSTENTVTIEAKENQTANVTLDNVNINVDEGYEHDYDPDQYKTAVEVTGSGNTNIELNGNNTLTSGYGHAGLEHNKTETSGKLTITDENKDGGILTANGGEYAAGIGAGAQSDGQVTIDGGTINATGGKQGAGIGGAGGRKDGVTYTGDGDVTINGGTINATGGKMAAGIGGGAYGNGEVEITGGKITAQGTDYYGSGIGGGMGSLEKIPVHSSSTGKTEPADPAGKIIGGNGTVTISGGTINATGGNMAAGIGSGYQGDGNVTITGDATIKNAQGGDGAAGIGGGANVIGFGGNGTVTIQSNATIESAQGGDEGAGIGGGAGGLGAVTITGNAEIQNATGGIGAAGIGGGAESEPDVDGTGNETGNTISIQGTEAGSPKITAQGGAAGETVNSNGEEETISGGAAIGSGSVLRGQENAPAAITIKGKVTIDATAGGSKAKGDAIAIGDALTGEQKFAGLPVGAVIKRWDSAGVDLTQEGDKPTEPEKPEKPNPENPNPNPENPNPNPENPNPNPENPNPNPENPNPNPENPNPNPENPNPNPENPNPNPENPNPNPENPNPNPENPNPEQPSQPEQPSEPSGAVSTSAPAEELTASDAEYLVTVEGLSVTNALGKQITHSCTQNVQGKVLTIRVNSIVATAHLTMDMLRTLKAQGVETIRFCTLLYRPTSVSIDALLNLGVDEADILWTHNGFQARLTVGGTDSSSLLQ